MKKTLPLKADDTMLFNKSQNSLSELWKEVRNLLQLRKDYLKLDILEKSTLLLGHLVLMLILLFLGCFALLCISFALAYLLGAWLESFVLAFLFVAGIYFILILLIYKLRYQIIFNPVLRVLRHIFLKATHNHDSETITSENQES